MVEGARLESVYTSKGYRGFESLSLRKVIKAASKAAFIVRNVPFTSILIEFTNLPTEVLFLRTW